MFASALAKLLARPRVANWLIRRARRTPYTHITSRDGTQVYMGRWWLFNPYGKSADGRTLPARWSWLPSIRVHHICRADDDPHLHDHPWNARTFILRGWYVEERQVNDLSTTLPDFGGPLTVSRLRETGYTGRLNSGEYHRIVGVPDEGVWTVFVTGKYRGSWGFLVNGVKIKWRKYLAARDRGEF